MKHNKTDQEYAEYFHPSLIANLPVQLFSKEALHIIEEHTKLEKFSAFKEQYAILSDRLSDPCVSNCEVVAWPKVLDPTCRDRSCHFPPGFCSLIIYFSCLTPRYAVSYSGIFHPRTVVTRQYGSFMLKSKG